MSATPEEIDADIEEIVSTPINVLEDNEDIEVSVIDDVPEEDRNRPARAEMLEGDDDGLDEAQFGKRIKKRIDKLRYQWNEERRAKDKAVRENGEAINYAQMIQAENETLKSQLEDQRKLLYDQVNAKTDAEIDGAKRRYRDAYEAGDPDALVDSQEELARLHAERSHYIYAAPDPSDQQEVVQDQQALQPQPENIPDPYAVNWLKGNAWFQQEGHEEKTGFAIGLHQKLVKGGVDPTGNPEYYRQIDDALRVQFPDFFGEQKTVASQAPTSRRTPVVAPARRGGNSPRKVELTGTQVSLARQRGLTAEQYAAQVVKEMT